MTAPTTEPGTVEEVPAGTWTGRVRDRAVRDLPPETLLPDVQPAYVASWMYVFGVATIAALVVVIASGTVLAVEGPQWYHGSDLGHFVNSLHLWSVELFLAFMVVHLWGKFFMAAWRGKRAATWITGGGRVRHLGRHRVHRIPGRSRTSTPSGSPPRPRTGSTRSGIGAFFNVLNYGQMLLFHALLLPVVLVALTIWHVLLVRRRGVVPPLPEHRHAHAKPPPTDVTT